VAQFAGLQAETFLDLESLWKGIALDCKNRKLEPGRTGATPTFRGVDSALSDLTSKISGRNFLPLKNYDFAFRLPVSH
jgi:hypothetical protein